MKTLLVFGLVLGLAAVVRADDECGHGCSFGPVGQWNRDDGTRGPDVARDAESNDIILLPPRNDSAPQSWVDQDIQTDKKNMDDMFQAREKLNQQQDDYLKQYLNTPISVGNNSSREQ